MKINKLSFLISCLALMIQTTIATAETGRGIIKIQNKSPYQIKKVNGFPQFYQMNHFDFPNKISATETGLAFIDFKKCRWLTECKDDSGIMKYNIQCLVDGEIKTDEVEIHADVYDPTHNINANPRVYVYQANPNPSCVVVKPNAVPQYFDQKYEENIATINVIPTYQGEL